MPRFFAQVSGAGSTAPNIHGTETTGISAEARGGRVGILAEGESEGATDTFHVYATCGSTPDGVREILATVTHGPNGYAITLYAPEVIEGELEAQHGGG